MQRQIGNARTLHDHILTRGPSRPTRTSRPRSAVPGSSRANSYVVPGFSRATSIRTARLQPGQLRT
jgi:hypothetical protein